MHTHTVTCVHVHVTLDVFLFDVHCVSHNVSVDRRDS